MTANATVMRVFEHSKACLIQNIPTIEMCISKSEAQDIADYFKAWDDEWVSAVSKLEVLTGHARQRSAFPLLNADTVDGSMLYGVKLKVV